MECSPRGPEKTNKGLLQDTLDPSQPLDQLSWRFSNESHADCIKNMISLWAIQEFAILQIIQISLQIVPITLFVFPEELKKL